ncbi:MAG: hypothetical protein F6K22_15865 [Okeania sp. SIO2F4]|uniref:glycerophosphoryl diester phosphodiesterase membrane domain-containing protein n=1 Tax=Okeania sp. SIO2F4 TaxID=2607790 RepID=UPI00142B93B4|nr:glycerophosphoryl diester phosphodiesterase membrane domain-containing protein [Okeania sp. SIO2F4]MDJ0517360.1 glycerophosphoryl diester phosphodiesterase membrane domain-containing protein [Trichodesmium sp. MO_231.B1]NES04180.1 hypothetical protein [Okeania sp. SIO2F4]
MQYRRINPVNLVGETLDITRSVYIPCLIIASLGFLITLASNLLSNLPIISPILFTIFTILVILELLWKGANIVYLYRHFSRNPISIKEAFNLSIKKIFKLFLASFIILLIFFVGLILFFFPGFYMIFRLLPFLYSIVIEDLSALDGISRSWQLTKGHWWLIFLSSLLIGIVLLIPVIILHFILLFLGIPEQIANIVSDILSFLTDPFFSVYGYLLYVNLKEDYNERLSNHQLNH